MIIKDRMHEPHNAAGEQQDAEDDHEALHAAPKNGPPTTPTPHWRKEVAAKREGIQERPAAAAAAFFAAFAAAEALRRRLVFGGVAGASPISSAVMMLVTNSLGPWSSKSMAVRSESDEVTMPRPKSSCLMVWPSCI